MNRKVFPFSAVLGQESIKNALIWNFVNPRIGGVLISGQKGTAKSTLVRGAENICSRRIVDIPLNITEDRLIGGIDFEKAIKTGVKSLEKGLLYTANNNILYVDEVNLLSDNIVKALLDSASSGVCIIEREGISEIHPASFILIGTMNPEESGLRPQFLDRFGLYVDTVGEENLRIRSEIIRRRIAFEQDEAGFIRQYSEQEKNLKGRIERAQEVLSRIKITENALLLAAQLSKESNCQGHRAEIVMIETARAICAWNGFTVLNKESILEAAKYALPHRMREASPEPMDREQPEEPQEQEQLPQENPPEPKEQQEQQEQEQEKNQSESEESAEDNGQESDLTEQPKKDDFSDAEDKVEQSGDPFAVAKWLAEKSKIYIQKGCGKRSLVKTNSLQGRYIKSRISRDKVTDIAFDVTLRAAAPYQKHRDKTNMALVIEKSDLRSKVREKRTGNFILFVVDSSGSMGVGRRMAAVKGAILSLLGDAYQKRDKVGLITFRKDHAELVLGMTRSVDLAQKKLNELPTGGRTPLCYGIEKAHNVIKAARLKEKDLLPVIVLVSDGRATFGHSKNPFADSVEAGKAVTADKIHTIVIDAEQDFIKLNMAGKLAEAMGADLFKLAELKAENILAAVGAVVKS